MLISRKASNSLKQENFKTEQTLRGNHKGQDLDESKISIVHHKVLRPNIYASCIIH